MFLPENLRCVSIDVVVALILRSINPGLYVQFIGGGTTDEEVADAIFKLSGLGTLGSNTDGAWVEATLIVGLQVLSDVQRTFDDNESLLLQRHKKIVDTARSKGDVYDKKTTYSQSVIEIAKDYWPGSHISIRNRTRMDFLTWVQRLELLSPDLRSDEIADEAAAVVHGSDGP